MLIGVFGAFVDSIFKSFQFTVSVTKSYLPCASPPVVKRKKRSSRSHRARYRRFRRRKLAYGLVQRCRSRQFIPSLLGPDLRRHWRWRRRKRRTAAKWRVKRRLQRQTQFLTPLQSGRELWNERRRVDSDFLQSESSPFLPHSSYGVVSEEVLDEFVCDRGSTFLASTKLMEYFETISLEQGAEETVGRLNLCSGSLGAKLDEK